VSSQTPGPAKEAMPEPRRLKVLFLCGRNACRSQMAEGWARRLKDDVIEPSSAGAEASEVDPRAVRVMAEAGVDISAQRSKGLEEFKGTKFDCVVTLCESAGEACPAFAGKAKRVHVAFDDPPKLAADARSEEEALAHYRRVRDEIRRFVERLPEALEE